MYRDTDNSCVQFTDVKLDRPKLREKNYDNWSADTTMEYALFGIERHENVVIEALFDPLHNTL